MARNPFTKRQAYEGLYVAQRRSTRVDWTTPVVLTGRDASGDPFREATETVRVNLHGAKIKTRHRVMLGAQINIENPVNGLSGKAICVCLEEAPPGETGHAIGVQLVRPHNLWGVETPPPDWERALAGEEGEGAPHEPESERMATSSGPVLASSSECGSRGTLESPPFVERFPARWDEELAELKQSFIEALRRETQEIAAGAVASSRQEINQAAAEAAGQIDERLTHSRAELNSALEAFRAEVRGEVESLRGHAWQITRETVSECRREVEPAVAEAARRMDQRLQQSLADLDSTLDAFRAEAAGDIVRETVQSFESRTASLAGDVEDRLAQRGFQALSELESVLESFRANLAQELMARKEETVEAAEQELRTRIASMLSTIFDPSADVPTIRATKPTIPKK